MAFGGSIGRGLSNLDPTTDRGLKNLGLGGAYGSTSDELAELDDQIRGEDQQDAAEEAARRQEEAGLAAVDLQERIYEEGVGRLDPFYQQGLGTLDEYFNLISPEGSAAFRQQYLESPEYLARRNETLGALEQSAAFGGTLGSGGALKRANQQLNTLAFDESNQALSQELARLGAGVDIGARSAGALTSAGQQFAGQASNTLAQIGQAQAAQEIAAAGQGIAPYLQLAGTAAQIYGAAV